MKHICLILMVLFLAITLHAEDKSSSDTENKSDDSATTVASSTSSSATTSVKKVEKIKKKVVKNNFSFSITNEFVSMSGKGRDDYRYNVVIPSLSYSVPNTDVLLGGDITINTWVNDGMAKAYGAEKRSIDGASAFVYKPIWKNTAGTSASGMVSYLADFVSTTDGVWTEKNSRIYANASLNQSFGKFSLRLRPEVYYYVQPDLDKSETMYKTFYGLKAQYTFGSYLALWTQAKFGRTFRYYADEYNTLTGYFGLNSGYKRFGLAAYVQSTVIPEQNLADQDFEENYTTVVDLTYSF